jgi:predicted NAD/FAD-binding protein
MIGCTIPDSKRSSARSILQTFALSFPKNLLKSATTLNSRIGLQGNLEAMVARRRDLSVHLETPVRGLLRVADHWFLEAGLGVRGPFDAVVINAPPRVGSKLVERLPWAAELASLLAGQEYFDSRLVIHSDPAFMPRDRRAWTLYNAAVDDGSCEGSVWLGKIQPREADGSRLSLFKSWATRRGDEPREPLAERMFRHPLITPDWIRRARRLARWQGVNGLWFAGQFTEEADLQETALVSGERVAAALGS